MLEKTNLVYFHHDAWSEEELPVQMSLPSAPAADSNGLFLLLPELGLSDKFCSTKVDETVDPLDDEEGLFLVLCGGSGGRESRVSKMEHCPFL